MTRLGIDRPVGVLAQGGRHERDVPGVLGIILTGPAAIDQRGAHHGAQVADLGDKSNLLAEAPLETFAQQIDRFRAHAASHPAPGTRPAITDGPRRPTG